MRIISYSLYSQWVLLLLSLSTHLYENYCVHSICVVVSSYGKYFVKVSFVITAVSYSLSQSFFIFPLSPNRRSFILIDIWSHSKMHFHRTMYLCVCSNLGAKGAFLLAVWLLKKLTDMYSSKRPIEWDCRITVDSAIQVSNNCCVSNFDTMP